MKKERKPSRREIILATFAAAGANARWSPVPSQKCIFLIERKAFAPRSDFGFEFRPDAYGPFSPRLCEDVAALVKARMIEETRSGGPSTIAYRIHMLSQKGFRRGEGILQDLPERISANISKLASWVQMLDFTQLMAAMHRDHPEMCVKSVFRKSAA